MLDSIVYFNFNNGCRNKDFGSRLKPIKEFDLKLMYTMINRGANLNKNKGKAPCFSMVNKTLF